LSTKMNWNPMANRCFIPLLSILPSINSGLNVNIVTNMIKALVLVGAIVLSGCATRTVPAKVEAPLSYNAMDNFKADCLYGETQRKFLKDKIEEYEFYHKDRPYTDAGRIYYIKLKNALWGLRSACGSNR
jgi:hypothetical protein